jgi:hypothetical protein
MAQQRGNTGVAVAAARVVGSPAAQRANWLSFPRLPLALVGVLAAFVLVPSVRDNPRLAGAFGGAAGGLAVWVGLLWVRSLRRGERLAIELAPPQKAHYVQASVQLSIYAYWGWYWRNVYDAAPLILGQLVFLYVFDALLAWTRGRAWRLGFGPLPIVLSTNFFMWFKDDWFAFQFGMLAVAALGKEFLRWNRDGKSTHIFNPSAFGLSVCSILLIAFGATRLTWGLEVATTLARPPHIFLQIFLLGLVVQYFFSVTLMTLSAVASLCLFGFLYQQLTGVHYFVDTNIPVAIFLGMHLLQTDPATSPRSNPGRVVFGAAYGLANVVLFWWLGEVNVPDFYDKLLPVPVLNLCVPLLDRMARLGWAARLATWEKAIAPRRSNLAHMGVWIALFATMWGTGYVDAPHEGASIRFWKQAYDQGKPFAGRNLVKMVGTRADSGDAAACNQLGALYLEGKMTSRDPLAAAHYFAKAAALGNLRGCENVVEHFFTHGYAVSQETLLSSLARLEAELDAAPDGRRAWLVGMAYETGQGREADRARALELFARASARGSSDADKRRARLAGEARPDPSAPQSSTPAAAPAPRRASDATLSR